MKKQLTVVMAAMMAVGMMAGCSSKPQETTAAATEAETTAEETTAAETEAESKEEAKADLGEQSILVAAAASLKNAYEDELIPRDACLVAGPDFPHKTPRRTKVQRSTTIRCPREKRLHSFCID